MASSTTPEPRIIVESDSTVIFFPNGTTNVCAKHKNVGSLGIWNGDNPIDFVLPVTLLQITLGVIVSETLYILLRPLKTPKFVCRVLGGIILGPSSFGANVSELMHALYPARQAELLFTMASIALSYYMFLLVLQMDVKTTLKAAKSTWRFGIVPFLSSIASLSSLSYMYGDKLFPSLPSGIPRTFFFAALSFSNFVVLCESITELNLASSELGKIALSSAMLNDVIQWVTILFSSFFKYDVFNHSLQFLGCYWLLILACVFVIRPIMFQIVKSTPVGKPVKEVYVVCILAGVLIMTSLTESIGLSSFMGPLLLGLVMPNGPPLGTTLVQKTQVVLSQFLLPFFFLYIGSNINIHQLKNWKSLSMLQWILVVGYVVKMVACILVALSYNMWPKHGLVMGFMMNLKGITELITFTRMKSLKLIDEQMYVHLVFNILLVTSIVSPLIELLYKPHSRLDRSTNKHGEAKICTIQDTPKNTEFGIICCVYNDGNVKSIMALLEASNPSIESPIISRVVHFVELLGKSTPYLLHVNSKNKRTSLSNNYPNTYHIMRAFENYAHDSKGHVTVQPYINVAPYKHMHEVVCRLAQDNSIPFLIIPFHENGQTVSSYTSSNFRDLNSNFQKYAPCTMGILVDRESRLSTVTNTECGLHVGVFFIGGPDDREALSLGIRMTEDNDHTKVTLLWMVMKNKNNNSNEELVEEDEEVEKMLNEGLIDEFKAKSIESDKVRYEEMVVEDGIGVLEAIRGMEGNNYNFDMVMVGRRHSLVKLHDEEMSNFMENVETLGIVGDMLSSSEFGKGKVPVLVTQCGGRKYGRSLNRFASSSSQFSNIASRSSRS